MDKGPVAGVLDHLFPDEARELRRHDKKHGITEDLDSQMMEIALGSVATSGIFNPVSEEYLHQDPRPDAIDHHKTWLPNNVLHDDEKAEVLGFVDILLGAEQVPETTSIYREFLENYDILDMLDQGKKIIVPSNHFKLEDQGYTLGYFHKGAEEINGGGYRLENFMTAMIGRALGYYEVLGKNVIDDILRKAGGVLKTLPVKGNEAVDESEIHEEIKKFRKYSNEKTKQAFDSLTRSSTGQIILMAAGGSTELPDENGDIHMQPFGENTREMIARACRNGAFVVPLFVDYDPSVSLVRFGELMQIGKSAKVHEIGERISAMGNHEWGRAQERHPHVDRFAGRIIYTPDES